MNFHVVTIFPKMFESYMADSILARAIKNKKISVKFYNPRDFTCLRRGDSRRGRQAKDKHHKSTSNFNTHSVSKKFWSHHKVDDRAYGGGPGMVMGALPVLRAVERAKISAKGGSAFGGKNTKIIILSPSGKKFTNDVARALSKSGRDIVLISGRYEGIDARVKKILHAEEYSIGDYVLTGGELPAMVVIDAVARQINGVLGKFESVEENRLSTSEVYTRPETLVYKGKNYKVPKVLLSGHRKKIEEWRKRKKKNLQPTTNNLRQNLSR